MSELIVPAIDARPSIYRDLVDGAASFGDVERTLSTWERTVNNTTFRRTCILVVLGVVWQVYATFLNNELMFPSFSATVVAFYEAIVHGPLLPRTLFSLKILIMGYGIGIMLAGALVSLAVATRFGRDLLSTLTAMFNPLPAIALLPLALLWFGLGNASIVFVVVHSVLWAVALNTDSGFQAVNETLRMSGRNFGLRGLRYP